MVKTEIEPSNSKLTIFIPNASPFVLTVENVMSGVRGEGEGERVRGASGNGQS